MGRKRTIDRDAVLDAAEAVVTELGAGRLTFDEVARRAGVSKGGVMYCFASKQDLIAAMARRDVARFEADVDRRRTHEGADALLSAHLAATREESDALAAKAASLMAALAESPVHADAIRDYYRHRLAQLAGDGPAPRRARLAFLAAEGAFMLRGLGLYEFGDAEWAALFDDMEALAGTGAVV